MIKRHLVTTAVVTIEKTRRVTESTSTKHGATTSIRAVPDGTLAGRCELHIDTDALVRMLGDKALRAKSLRTRLAGGLIEVRVAVPTLVRRDVDGKVREK